MVIAILKVAEKALNAKQSASTFKDLYSASGAKQIFVGAKMKGLNHKCFNI